MIKFIFNDSILNVPGGVLYIIEVNLWVLDSWLVNLVTRGSGTLMFRFPLAFIDGVIEEENKHFYSLIAAVKSLSQTQATSVKMFSLIRTLDINIIWALFQQCASAFI